MLQLHTLIANFKAKVENYLFFTMQSSHERSSRAYLTATWTTVQTKLYNKAAGSEPLCSRQCCGTGTGTVGTVTFFLVEPEPEP
jgi:hypothetical protein